MILLGTRERQGEIIRITDSKGRWAHYSKYVRKIEGNVALNRNSMRGEREKERKKEIEREADRQTDRQT